MNKDRASSRVEANGGTGIVDVGSDAPNGRLHKNAVGGHLQRQRVRDRMSTSVDAIALAALAEQHFGPLEHRCRRRASHDGLITFDGSLSGGGVTLQAGVRQFRATESSPFVA